MKAIPPPASGLSSQSLDTEPQVTVSSDAVICGSGLNKFTDSADKSDSELLPDIDCRYNTSPLA